MRIALFLLLAACAAPSPIPTGDRPSWVSTPNGDLRFPPDRFVAAVGSVPVGQQPAPALLATVDAAARKAVLAQLAAAVAAGFDPGPGIHVEGRFRQGDTAYAWAVFDRAAALAEQAARVAARQKAAAELLAQAEAGAADDPLQALRTAARARLDSAAADDGLAVVRGLEGKADVPATTAAAESRAKALAGELTLTVVDGDRQLGVPGRPLPQPIVFTAWLKGKKAVGLPVAVSMPGGRAAAAAVGEGGRGEARVDDPGKFEPVVLAADWPALTGAPAAAVAWLPAVSVSATVLRKSVQTTRVLVLAAERALANALTGALQKAGFAVQDGQGLIDKFGAERIAAMTDAQLREAARKVAEVVVVGSVGGDVHALDIATGQELFRARAGKGVSSALQAALVKSATP